MLANDSDTDSLIVVAAIDDQPITVNGWVTVANGNVMLNPDNKLTFMPATNFNGETSFTYKLNTGFSATVTVMVDPVEDATVVGGDLHAVVAEGDIVTLEHDGPDRDRSGRRRTKSLVYTVTSASHGLVTAERVGHRSVHAGRPCGRPGVEFQHDAGEDDGPSIVLSLSGGTAAPPRRHPSRRSRSARQRRAGGAGRHGERRRGHADLRRGDSRLDVGQWPGELTYSLVGENGGALHGSIVMNADGTFVYTPDAEFSGTDMIVFRAVDAGGVESSAAVDRHHGRPE